VMEKARGAIAALMVLAWSGLAWAITDTSVTVTNEGQPVPEAKISLTTSEGPTPKVVRKSDSSGRVPVRYDEKKVKRTTRVHLTVRARVPTTEGRTREVTREVEVSMDALISGQLVIDLVGRAPPGAPPVTNVPGDWPGTYFGGGGGGRWTRCPDFDTVAITSFGAADRVGEDHQACASSGFRGSIMLGTNWQVAPNWIVGAEADFGLGNTSGTIAGIPGAANVVVPAARAANDSVNMKEGWDAGVRARLGYLVTPWVMVFGTAGVAWQQVEVTMNCSAAGTCGFNGIAPFSATNSTVLTGVSFGGGIDVKLAGNWSARGEYRYADYGTWRTTFGSPSTLAVTTDIRMRTHTALFGLAYTFAGRPQ
jgi:outer membrane immunogenic protein